MSKIKSTIMLVCLLFTLSLSAKFRAEVQLVSKKPVEWKREETKADNKITKKTAENNKTIILRNGKLINYTGERHMGVSDSDIFLSERIVNFNNESRGQIIQWFDSKDNLINEFDTTQEIQYDLYLTDYFFNVKTQKWFIALETWYPDNYGDYKSIPKAKDPMRLFLIFSEDGDLITKVETINGAIAFGKSKDAIYENKCNGISKHVYCDPYILTTDGEIIHKFPENEIRRVPKFTNDENYFTFEAHEKTPENRFNVHYYTVQNTRLVLKSHLGFARNIFFSQDYKLYGAFNNQTFNLFIINPKTMAPSSEIEFPYSAIKNNMKNVKFAEDSNNLIITTDKFEYEMEFSYEKIK